MNPHIFSIFFRYILQKVAPIKHGQEKSLPLDELGPKRGYQQYNAVHRIQCHSSDGSHGLCGQRHTFISNLQESVEASAARDDLRPGITKCEHVTSIWKMLSV